MNGGFIEGMSEAVQRHLELCYRTEVSDSHVPFLEAQASDVHAFYCGVWGEYTRSLFECVCHLVRCERSLTAWAKVVPSLDEDVRLTCLADYAYPVLRLACDTPTAFKDRLMRGAVKLTALARGDHSLIEAVAGDEDGRKVDWIKQFGRLRDTEPSSSALCDHVEGELYRSVDAGHFRALHGSALHDASPTLMAGNKTAFALPGGLLCSGWEGPLGLNEELEAIGRHRLSIQRGYLLFDEYARGLFERLG